MADCILLTDILRHCLPLDRNRRTMLEDLLAGRIHGYQLRHALDPADPPSTGIAFDHLQQSGLIQTPFGRTGRLTVPRPHGTDPLNGGFSPSREDVVTCHR